MSLLVKVTETELVRGGEMEGWFGDFYVTEFSEKHVMTFDTNILSIDRLTLRTARCMKDIKTETPKRKWHQKLLGVRLRDKIIESEEFTHEYGVVVIGDKIFTITADNYWEIKEKMDSIDLSYRAVTNIINGR